jgi:5-methylcytosine-specific restriction endonuclease McrA
MTKDKNPNWKGGTSTEQGRGENWQRQKKSARERDNYTCQNCHRHAVAVHHIKPYRFYNGDWESANILTNLITLCASCHSKIEHEKIPCPIPKLF